jgi:hypothetical protein
MALRDMVLRDLDKFTVIATVLEVLRGHIAARKTGQDFGGLPPIEIKSGYDKSAQWLGRRPFYPTYLQRHTKEGDYFQETAPGKYTIRSELVTELSLRELEALQDEILSYWNALRKAEQQLLEEIEATINLKPTAIDARYQFIHDRLQANEGNPGQHLEIMAYSILSTYFSALGFSLRRFSTTFANDGGMDFISSDAFYQVTTSPTRSKIASDLSKLPGIPRVFVAPSFSANVMTDLPDKVLAAIEIDDLTNHFLHWLHERDKRRGSAHHLQRVLEIAHREYSREYS